MKRMINVLKFRLWINVAWGALVVFILLGALLNKSSAPFMAIGVAVMWVLMRIITEATDSWLTLGTLKGVSDETNKKEDTLEDSRTNHGKKKE